ncbi:MAG: HEAT repeat domain-containing protein [Planctomycetota bacterium]|jgi:hypothetical protein
MRMFLAFLAFSALVVADDKAKSTKLDPVSDEEAKEAIAAFDKEMKAKEIEVKQNAVYNLHDVPHPLVLKRLAKTLKHKDPRVRSVVALAIAGQRHDIEGAGALLMKTYEKDFKSEEVVTSVLQGLTELGYLGYWPTLKPAMKDKRNAIVIATLETLGTNKDWRSLPTLLDAYHVAMPKKVSWSTGTVNVDTGAAGDADQKAAEAKFNAKYGSGGSKAKAKAKAKARGQDLRNFSEPLRKTVKKITGEDFDNAWDFEDWYVTNYIKVWRKIAEMSGKDPDAAERKAKGELPALKKKIEEHRKKVEEKLAKDREKAEKKK